MCVVMLPYSTRSFIGRGYEGHAHDERVAREEVEEVALGDLYLFDGDDRIS